MEIVSIPGATRVLGEAQGYRPLPLRDDFIDQSDGTKMHTMVTQWEPTADEREAILKGAPIYLSIIGGMHPLDRPDWLCVMSSGWPPAMIVVGLPPESNGG